MDLPDNIAAVCPSCHRRVNFGDEADDGGLEIDEGMKDTPLEAPFREFGKEPLDSIEPRARCCREVKGEAFMAVQPRPDLRVFMGYDVPKMFEK